VILVRKPVAPPKVLVEQGAEQRARDLAAYDEAPLEYVDGTRKFTFDRKVYAHESVRRALRAAQHDKCCFCESKISHVGADDVEHFRPKAGVRQQRFDGLVQPGYYWLAYDWTNLYLACRECNERNKQNLFPLERPEARPCSHHEAHKCEDEQPLFLDPGDPRVNPESVIGFREGEPYPIGGNVRAEVTMRELELGRRSLMERRDERIRVLRVLVQTIEAFRRGQLEGEQAGPLALEAAELLARFTEDRAAFTATTRHYLRARFGRDLRFPLGASELFAYAQGELLPP
jgi:uncharacterized protein (TIGR02646 family)